jgi:hypothetical protein
MTSTTESVLLEAALRYAGLGLRVIPLRPRDKAPILSDWPAKATTESDTIRKWWQQYPDANIGLVCGDLFVLDVDGAPGWDSLAAVGLKPEQLPVTWLAETGREGGQHLFFRSQSGLRSRVRLLPGVDIKGAGGYVVAAPSVHPNGNHYKWQADRGPWNVELAELPDELVQLLHKRDQHSNGDDGDRGDDTPIPEGERNDSLFKLGCSLRRTGLLENEIKTALISMNQRRCIPPLEEAEVEKIAASCANYPAGGDSLHDAGGRRRSTAARLIGLALASIHELFQDEEGDCYATIVADDHRETHNLKSKAVHRWLIGLLYNADQAVPTAQTLADVTALLAAKAQYESEATYNVYLRVGEANSNIYIDLGSPSWRIVEIRADGWNVIEYADCPVHFRRSAKTGPLPEPERGGSIVQLREFVNVSNNEWSLVVAWLLQAFRGRGNYPVLPLRGGQGDGKTTLARVLKGLIDPDSVQVRFAPGSLRDLVAAARGAHLLAFDNLSRLSAELSDALCCLSTGGGFGGRELYSDFDEAAFAARRPVILTSITEVVSRPDLLDRSIIITMVPLADRAPGEDERAREPEETFWSKFTTAKPCILGALYDALAAGLRDHASVALPETTRMADFAVWASACLPTLGISADDFFAAYKVNREGANETALEASVIAEPIKALVTAESPWHGTAGDLLGLIRNMVGEPTNQQPGFPQTPRAMRAALEKIKPNLRAAGFTVEFGRRGHGGTRKITITKCP